eukprot:8028281-Alexandrium_andersonii.AAC.1
MTSGTTGAAFFGGFVSPTPLTPDRVRWTCLSRNEGPPLGTRFCTSVPIYFCDDDWPPVPDSEPWSSCHIKECW